MGVFWYGQYQQYGFTAPDQLSGKDLSGVQSIFFSNVEARVGLFF